MGSWKLSCTQKTESGEDMDMHSFSMSLIDILPILIASQIKLTQHLKKRKIEEKWKVTLKMTRREHIPHETETGISKKGRNKKKKRIDGIEG